VVFYPSNSATTSATQEAGKSHAVRKVILCERAKPNPANAHGGALVRTGIHAQARSFLAGDGFGMDVQYHSLNESA
jgi:hypothetical protein